MKIVLGLLLSLSAISHAGNVSCDSKSADFAKYFKVRCDEGIDHYVISCSERKGLVMVECTAETIGVASKAIPCDCQN